MDCQTRVAFLPIFLLQDVFGISALWIVAENRCPNNLFRVTYIWRLHTTSVLLVVHSSGVLMYPLEGKSTLLSDMTIYQCLTVSQFNPAGAFFPTHSCTKNLDPDFLPKKLTWIPSVEMVTIKDDGSNFPLYQLSWHWALEQIRKSSILGHPNVHCDWTLDFLPRFQEILSAALQKTFSPRNLSRNPSMAWNPSGWLTPR